VIGDPFHWRRWSHWRPPNSHWRPQKFLLGTPKNWLDDRKLFHWRFRYFNWRPEVFHQRPQYFHRVPLAFRRTPPVFFTGDTKLICRSYPGISLGVSYEIYGSSIKMSGTPWKSRVLQLKNLDPMKNLGFFNENWECSMRWKGVWYYYIDDDFFPESQSTIID